MEVEGGVLCGEKSEYMCDYCSCEEGSMYVIVWFMCG